MGPQALSRLDDRRADDETQAEDEQRGDEHRREVAFIEFWHGILLFVSPPHPTYVVAIHSSRSTDNTITQNNATAL